MIVTTVVLTNAAQAKCFHSQCRSRMYAVTHQILNLNCVLSQMAINGTCEATPTRPQNSYPSITVTPSCAMDGSVFPLVLVDGQVTIIAGVRDIDDSDS